MLEAATGNGRVLVAIGPEEGWQPREAPLCRGRGKPRTWEKSMVFKGKTTGNYGNYLELRYVKKSVDI